MKHLFFLLFNACAAPLSAQNAIEWSDNYQIQLSDFVPSNVEIGGSMSFLHNGITTNFSYQMSNYEFLFTKNFNDKVSVTFNPPLARLTAPDRATALEMVEIAQLDFDLAELYARKFRQKIYENKDAFSDTNFMTPFFDSLQYDVSVRSSLILKNTAYGSNKAVLATEQQKVEDEILALSDFCRTCKPKKKKKK